MCVSVQEREQCDFLKSMTFLTQPGFTVADVKVKQNRSQTIFLNTNDRLIIYIKNENELKYTKSTMKMTAKDIVLMYLFKSPGYFIAHGWLTPLAVNK